MIPSGSTETAGSLPTLHLDFPDRTLESGTVPAGLAGPRVARDGPFVITIGYNGGGRVPLVNVEYRGRIGHFWNRAKHVIVYEQTSQDSPVR